MSREYPDWLDPWKAAEGKRTFAGSMPLKRMPRLLPLLADSGGEAQFSAAFSFDPQARVTIQVTVDAQLPLVCQTSLETYFEPVRRASLLGVMENLAEESMMPENYEPVLAPNGRLALQDLVEDELLLGMPQVPRKPQAEPVIGQAVEAQRIASVESPGAQTRGGQETDSAGEAGQPRVKDAVRQPFAGLAEQLKKFAAEKNPG